MRTGSGAVPRCCRRPAPPTPSSRPGPEPGAPSGFVLATDHQTAGRGRLGRTWTAPRGSSIAMSVLLRPAREPATWTWLPLLAGLAVADSLRAMADVPAVLKWPNDVLVDGAKICGILAERVDAPSGAACVLGLGINVHLAADELPVPTATSLAVLRPGQTLRPDRDHGHRARGPGAALPPLAGLPRQASWSGSTWLAATPSAEPSGCCRLTGRAPRARRSMWTPRGGSGSGRPPASRSSPPVTCSICADQRGVVGGRG